MLRSENSNAMAALAVPYAVHRNACRRARKPVHMKFLTFTLLVDHVYILQEAW